MRSRISLGRAVAWSGHFLGRSIACSVSRLMGWLAGSWFGCLVGFWNGSLVGDLVGSNLEEMMRPRPWPIYPCKETL